MVISFFKYYKQNTTFSFIFINFITKIKLVYIKNTAYKRKNYFKNNLCNNFPKLHKLL